MPALIVLFIIAVIIWFQSQSASSSTAVCTPPCCAQNPCCQGNAVTENCSITNDPATWPSGDRIWLVCHAIAIAEGANIAGSVPDRLNNPGDISDYLATYGGEWHSGSEVTKFPDKQTGWNSLHEKFSNIAAGKSFVYFPTDSWTTIALKYAGNSQAWLNNVTNTLSVDPNSTLQDYLNA